jgi:hypothetical protein
MQFEPIPVNDDDDEDGPYYLVDEWIRDWIENDGLAHKGAVFPMEMWNMCGRCVFTVVLLVFYWIF